MDDSPLVAGGHFLVCRRWSFEERSGAPLQPIPAQFNPQERDVLAMHPQPDYLSYCGEERSWCPERGGPVARRNERERKRVRLVNMGFAKLRQYIPVSGRPGKRLSKVETLRSAIDYIRQLRQMLRQPLEPPYYYPPPPDPNGYRCDFGCPCNEEYSFDGSTEMVVSYISQPYLM